MNWVLLGCQSRVTTKQAAPDSTTTPLQITRHPTKTPSLDPTKTPHILAKPIQDTTPTPIQTFSDLLPENPVFSVITYQVQPGDGLQAIATRFEVDPSAISCAEQENTSFCPFPATSLDAEKLLPPGLQLIISGENQTRPAKPAEWLLPDSEVVYAPSQIDFDTIAYTNAAGGYLATHRQYYVFYGWLSGAETVAQVALENSINPKLLLALLEYQCKCVLGNPGTLEKIEPFMGANNHIRADLYGQLTWAVDQLSKGYYGWRTGTLRKIQLSDGKIHILDPNLNAGSAAIFYLFAQLYGQENWEQAVDPTEGFPAVYQVMFGDPWIKETMLFTAKTSQPPLALPFEPGKVWSYTGGPHPAWEGYGPLASLDFAPPSNTSGCFESEDWVTAMADGLVVRVEPGLVVQDLDGDGLEQTGWVLLYLHIAPKDQVNLDSVLKTGDQIGHPSCEGGRATGSHVHIVRKYNGEWIAADSPLPFNLGGWIAHAGSVPYQGSLTRGEQTLTACPCSASSTWISYNQ